MHGSQCRRETWNSNGKRSFERDMLGYAAFRSVMAALTAHCGDTAMCTVAMDRADGEAKATLCQAPFTDSDVIP